MSLEYTLLGCLDVGPMTGYDLKKMLDDTTLFFWHAELSQIYPALKQLEKRKLIASQTQPQDGKPDKKIHSITPQGREHLRAWLSEPLDSVPPVKNPALLKLFFSGGLPKEEILDQLRCQLAVQRAQLKRLQLDIPARMQSAPLAGAARPRLMWELARRYGEAQAEMTIRWLEEAIESVEKEVG